MYIMYHCFYFTHIRKMFWEVTSNSKVFPTHLSSLGTCLDMCPFCQTNSRQCLECEHLLSAWRVKLWKQSPKPYKWGKKPISWAGTACLCELQHFQPSIMSTKPTNARLSTYTVCQDLGVSLKSNKKQLCDYTTTGPAWLAKIPVLRWKYLG